MTDWSREAWGACVVCAVAGFIVLLAHCGVQAPTPANVAGAECVTHRTALQLSCIDLYDSGADIDACRARVKAAIDCVKDGGP